MHQYTISTVPVFYTAFSISYSFSLISSSLPTGGKDLKVRNSCLYGVQIYILICKRRPRQNLDEGEGRKVK